MNAGGRGLNKSRDFATAAIAGLLSVGIPGAGHFYIGRRRRFLLPFFSLAATVVLLGYLGLLSTLDGFIGMMALGLAVSLFGMVDSTVLGFRSGPGGSSWPSRIASTLLWALAIVALMMIWVAGRESLLGYAVYRIPSPTMKPTLEVGDMILVSTRRPAGTALVPGSIVVVRHAGNSQLYVRRLQQRIGSNRFLLSHDWTWAARSSDPETAAEDDVVGMVTAVLWSPQRQKVAFIPN